jgi:hypothetical protein
MQSTHWIDRFSELDDMKIFVRVVIKSRTGRVRKLSEAPETHSVNRRSSMGKGDGPLKT